MTNAMERTSPYRFHLSSRRTSCAAPVLDIDHLGWKCPAAKSLCIGGAAAHVCRHWAEKTCNLAEQCVRKAFPTEDKLLSIAKRPPSRSIPLLMALAGSDTEDHVATMRLAEALFREKIPGVSTALIHPGELRSLAFANRKIMEKLRNAVNAASDCKASQDDDELNDPDFEEEPEELPIPANFLESLRGDGAAGGIPLTVLLFEGVDAAPKDVLRQVLCFWHAQCLEDGAPLLIFFGLKQLPPSRQSLFDLEDDEQLPFIHIDTVQLFDSSKVCEQLLDALMEDCSCPLTMCPDILKRLREIYCLQRQSVSYILQALFLVFDDAMADSAIAGFGEPLLRLCNDGNDAPPQVVQNHFQDEFQRRVKVACREDEVFKQFQHLWPQEARSSAARRVADAAAEAMAWRCRLVASLPLYEVLMIGAWNAVRFYSRLRKIHPLLEALWPVPASGEAKQREALDKQFRSMQDMLNCLEIKDLRRLLHDIRRVSSSCVSKTLAQELQGLVKQADELPDAGADKDQRRGLEQLRLSFRSWVDRVREQYWKPLGGRARDVFLARGSLNCSKESLDMAEKNLTSKFEVKLQHLAAVPVDASEKAGAMEPLADAARIFQLLECSSGRQIKVAELWCTFTQLVSDFDAAEVMKAPKSKGASGEKEKDLQGLKKRFQTALLALHHLGLFSPAPGSAQKGLNSLRVKKRIFGRVWLREPNPREELRGLETTPPKVSKEPAEPLAAPVISPKRLREKQPPPPPPVVEEESALAPGNALLKSLPHGRRYADKNDDDWYTPQKKRKKDKIFFG